MVNTNKGRGRPRKDADIEHPRRLETQRAVDSLMKSMIRKADDGSVREDEVDARSGEQDTEYDRRPIIIHEEAREQEQKPPAPADADTLLTAKQKAEYFEEVTRYRCEACKHPVLEGYNVCPGCGSGLDWKRVI